MRAYLDAVVDALVRTARGGPSLNGSRAPGRAKAPASRAKTARAAPDAWADRWRTALGGAQRGFETDGFAERSVVDELARWSEPALGARDRLRACFRLELPVDDGEPFVLRFLLQSPDDPSLLVPASDVWKTKGRSLEKLGRAFRDPQESLLEALGRASRLFPPLAGSLEEARPEAVELDPSTAWTFLGDGAALLAEAGFGVIVPGELTAAGQRRLRLRMRVGGSSKKVAGVVTGAAGLALDELLAVDWEAVIGDEPLTARELAALAKVVFLHGGTPKQARDELVRRFQEEPHGPRVFVLSVKAGGTGLNLTAASHVFYYDRWWNPAVEDQATDRAYRIGQKRAVQVHKLVCAGTVEEKIDRLLDQKRDLASRVVGAGEQWITELDGRELRDLFSLSEGAVADGDDDDAGSSAPARPRAKARAARARSEVRP